MQLTFRSGIVWTLRAIASLAIGCGSASVSNESTLADGTPNPHTVYVGTFDLGETAIQSDPGTLTGRPRLLSLFHNQDPAAEIARLQDLLASDIVSDLIRAGLPAQRLDAGGPRPTTGWLVTGEFLELQEGNRAQRAVIGLGAGDSDAKLYVSLADLSHPEGQNLLNFNADTSGDKTPGGGIAAVATHTPWGIVAKFALGRDASERDIQHAARAISDEIVRVGTGG